MTTPNWSDGQNPKTGKPSPVRCVACDLTFITVQHYLHLSHQCAVKRHPSSRTKETTMINNNNTRQNKAGA
jgi:L-ascorbate metabolism protein UlaG (beta-lactamase superfamily)